MPGHGEKKNRKQEAAVAALLSHATLSQAASAIGIDESSLRRWLQDPAFKQRYYQARADLLQHSLGHLAEGLVEAAIVLRVIMRSSETPASARVAAAKALFDLALKDRAVQDYEERIAALEAAQALHERLRGGL